MLEAEDRRMQGLAAESLQCLLLRLREAVRLGLEARPVGGIAQERMAEMGHVNPDLVRASRLQLALDQAGHGVCRRQPLQDLEMGDGIATAILAHYDDLLAVVGAA